MEGSNIDIRQFQSFKAVVELCSFTKAAQVLQYSQASITTHIKQLEEEMGVRLFDRLGKQIQLTPVGQELYGHIEELLTAYAKIKSISSDPTTMKGELRIGASESLTSYKLGGILANFIKRFPEVTLTIINDHCPLLRDRLHSGDIDIAITMEPPVQDPQLITKIFSEEPLVFVGEKNHNFKSIEGANGECIIFSEKNCALRRFFEGYLVENGIHTYNHMEFTSMESIKQCVINGLGISLMPYISVSSLLKDKAIKEIKTIREDLLLYGQISYHKNKWLSKAHTEFIDMVLAL